MHGHRLGRLCAAYCVLLWCSLRIATTATIDAAGQCFIDEPRPSAGTAEGCSPSATAERLARARLSEGTRLFQPRKSTTVAPNSLDEPPDTDTAEDNLGQSQDNLGQSPTAQDAEQSLDAELLGRLQELVAKQPPEFAPAQQGPGLDAVKPAPTEPRLADDPLAQPVDGAFSVPVPTPAPDEALEEDELEPPLEAAPAEQGLDAERPGPLPEPVDELEPQPEAAPAEHGFVSEFRGLLQEPVDELEPPLEASPAEQGLDAEFLGSLQIPVDELEPPPEAAPAKPGFVSERAGPLQEPVDELEPLLEASLSEHGLDATLPGRVQEPAAEQPPKQAPDAEPVLNTTLAPTSGPRELGLATTPLAHPVDGALSAPAPTPAPERAVEEEPRNMTTRRPGSPGLVFNRTLYDNVSSPGGHGLFNGVSGLLQVLSMKGDVYDEPMVLVLVCSSCACALAFCAGHYTVEEAAEVRSPQPVLSRRARSTSRSSLAQPGTERTDSRASANYTVRFAERLSWSRSVSNLSSYPESCPKVLCPDLVVPKSCECTVLMPVRPATPTLVPVVDQNGNRMLDVIVPEDAVSGSAPAGPARGARRQLCLRERGEDIVRCVMSEDVDPGRYEVSKVEGDSNVKFGEVFCGRGKYVLRTEHGAQILFAGSYSQMALNVLDDAGVLIASTEIVLGGTNSNFDPKQYYIVVRAVEGTDIGMILAGLSCVQDLEGSRPSM